MGGQVGGGGSGWGGARGAEGCRNHLGTVRCQGPRCASRGPSPSAASQADGPRALGGSASLAQQDPKSTCLFLLHRFSHLRAPQQAFVFIPLLTQLHYLLSVSCTSVPFPFGYLNSIFSFACRSQHAWAWTSCPVPGHWSRHPGT